MYYLNRDCIYDVSKLDPMWIEELFELLVFNDGSWNISSESNFNYVERILEGTSGDTWLHYVEGANEWFFNAPDCLDTKYIEAVIDLSKYFKEYQFKYNSKIIFIL